MRNREMGVHHPGQADERKGKAHLQNELIHGLDNHEGHPYGANADDLIAPHLERMRQDPDRENGTRRERRRVNRLLGGIARGIN